jgi:aminopeptidase N
MKKLVLAMAAAASLAACAPSQQKQITHTAMVVQLPRDSHSFSKPNEVRVSHLNWNATVDFTNHSISGVATFDLIHVSEADSVVFDAKGLVINKVLVDGKEAEFTYTDSDNLLGGALVVAIAPASKQVAIDYKTGTNAEALLWVDGENPFLFTQSQAILARTWIPCQDSPGVRFTYDATVKVPSNVMALMSADNPQTKNVDGVYSFKMDKPIPAYLMALAAGNVEFRAIDSRTGVYAIPEEIAAATAEFEDMPSMVEAAEKLYGPYVWGRYDVLVLPAAFPFGGMENPKLTFATPTIIAGDKSLVSLIAHELAHSWSGNLVTNATWNDFWLNEGFTVYFEERIMESVYGREFSEMLAQLSRQDLDGTLAEIAASEHPEDSKLKLQLEGRSPDDGMTDIAYNKGYFLLRLLEEHTGREKFDAFLKNYFTSHSFQVMDTEKFIDYLKKNLISEQEYADLKVNQWIYEQGLPDNVPVVKSDRLANVDAERLKWEASKGEIMDKIWNSWSYQEKYRFISNFSDEVTAADMTDLDKVLFITETKNNEVLFAWLEQSILKHYTPAYGKLETFLNSVGRRKFVAPLFEALVKTNQKDLAEKIYSTSRAKYHSVTIGTVDKILGK